MSPVSLNVMAGFGPAIHDFPVLQVMDTRPEAGHDAVSSAGAV